jgi:hypothetical protein
MALWDAVSRRPVIEFWTTGAANGLPGFAHHRGPAAAPLDDAHVSGVVVEDDDRFLRRSGSSVPGASNPFLTNHR